MGFQLRSDDNRPARDGMLDLLRDAFTTNATCASTISWLPPSTTASSPAWPLRGKQDETAV